MSGLSGGREDGAGLPVRAVRVDVESSVGGDDRVPGRRWPFDLPAVRDLCTTGLDLGRLTVLVGENGAGKSTIVEAVAMAYGLSPEGGSTGARYSSRASESELYRHLVLQRGFRTTRRGFFLRSETVHGFYTFLEDHPGAGGDPAFHELSHGESVLELLADRVDGAGFYVLDEPESGLSFRSTLALVALLSEIADSRDRQALVATHSPILAATPGARIVEVTDHGLAERDWSDLDLVQDWRRFLARPEQYLRHL